MLELLVPSGDERTHGTIRALRDDRNAYARVLAVLACAVELDGQTGRFRFESVYQLTHGPHRRSTGRGSTRRWTICCTACRSWRCAGPRRVMAALVVQTQVRLCVSGDARE